MKKLLILLLLCIFLSGCVPNSTDFSSTDEPIQETADEEITTVLGKPFDTLYNSNTAKNPWDMIFFDEKLFVGSGDYTNHMEGCKIACFDIVSQQWTHNTVPDEEINQFIVINDRLIAPGIDPTEGWNLGNYYIHCDTGWKTVRNIPNGIHNFSMTEYNETLFVGLGTTEGNYPAAVSRDNGKTFIPIPFSKNGQPFTVTDSAKDRVYDLFVLNNRLFAVTTANNSEIFLYNEDCFEYFDSWLYKAPFAEVDFLQELQKRGGFLSSVTHKDSFYFTTGFLFKTCDGKTVEHIPIDNNQYTVDLYCDSNVLYALGCRRTEEGRYLSSIYVIEGKECQLLFSICDDSFPISLAVNGSDFYLGFAYTIYDSEISGAIIKYSYKGEQK